MDKNRPTQSAVKNAAPPGNAAAGSEHAIVVVGIGAAAGALKSLKKLIGGLPSGRGIAVILIHHPELTKKSLINLLKNQTTLEVAEAAEGTTVLADRIYVMPPDKFLNIAQDRLTLTAPVHCDGLLMPIDHFFCSLAADRRNRCCGILLSGGGGDGTLGLSEIRAAQGRTIVEDPKDAKTPDMRQNAINAGVADTVLAADAIAGSIIELAGRTIASIQNETTASPEMDPAFKVILEILRTRISHDFRCYKPGTLQRRIRRRMTLGKIATVDDYTRYLAENPGEVGLLQKDLLIGVTEFFRQPSAWETLENRVIAQLLADAAPGSEIRVWVPGCSTGKEVYSLAMLLAEAVEKSNGKTNFQIFATDADLASLATARTGSYATEEIAGNISADRLERFFARRDGHYQVIKSIRERVVFAAQNITADPPFSRLDLIICRNLLIYLDQQVQRKIIALFHFALRDGGFLFLGNAETIGDREDLFEPISKKWRIYRRIGVGHRTNVEIPTRTAGDVQPSFFKSPAAITTHRPSLTSMAQQVLLDRFAPACVMIDRKLQVLYVHGMIENYLTIPSGELTTRVVDMAREGLRARLRGAIDKCIETGRPVSISARTRRGDKSVPVKTTVSALRHLRETDGLLLITFEDQRIPVPGMSGKPAVAQDDVRQLADELKITREELQSTIDQLEGSNDQLKASNEEVMAANEELQSANEEMETSKEELQSLNEELNTINLRLQEKVDELESTNNDVVNLLASTSIATAFLDKKFRIRRYTPAIIRLMSLIPTDMGRPIGDILLRFTDDALLEDAHHVLVDLTPRSREVQADDGRWYIRRIMPYRTQDDRIEGVVVTFIDITELKLAEEALEESRRRLAVILDSIADGFFAVDRQWRFTHINDAALLHFRKAREEVMGRNLFDVFPASRGTAFETGYRHAMESGEPVHFETPSTIADRMMEIHAYPGRENLTVLFRDITERHRLTQALQEAHQQAAWLARFPGENPNPVLRVSADGVILYCNPASVRNGEWACKVGECLPGPLLPHIAPAMSAGEETYREIQLGKSFYAVTLTPSPAESYLNVYGRNITKRKQAEESLRRSEERLKRAQEIAHLGSWELDLIDNRLVWSDEVYRIFGLQPQEFAATYEAFLEGVHPDDRVAVDAAYSGSIQEDHDTYEIEHRVIRKDTGEIRFVHERCQHFRNAAGKIIRSVGMVHDITERKRVEEALRESEERLQLFIEHAPAALAMFDRQMRYLSVSRRWRSDYGLGDRTLIGVSHYDVFPEISAEWREAHRRGFAGEVLRAEADRFERADGSAQWVRWEIRPWYDAAGSVGGIVIFSEDVTESQMAAEVLENRSKQLEAANRELESFSYTVSHDLRAPLRAIDGFSRMLLRKHGDTFDDEARRKFDAIRDNARMMGQLIDDLLEFSRLGRTQPSMVMLDMEALIREVWEELEAISPERRLTLKMTEIPPGRGDRGLIKQVLVNILSNAVKFTRMREEALIEAGGYLQGSECVYYIRDNGVGFDMQYHDKLFGVFQRLHTSDEFEGTGVGLAIVQRIILRHRGRVWAESRMGEGTTFYVTLPLEPADFGEKPQ